jgi:hypothetical protein
MSLSAPLADFVLGFMVVVLASVMLILLMAVSRHPDPPPRHRSGAMLIGRALDTKRTARSL